VRRLERDGEVFVLPDVIGCKVLHAQLQLVAGRGLATALEEDRPGIVE
jgi:hypothetical protein